MSSLFLLLAFAAIVSAAGLLRRARLDLTAMVVARGPAAPRPRRARPHIPMPTGVP